MAQGGSKVVAQFTCDPNIKDQNPPTAGNGEKIAEKKFSVHGSRW